jgi:hypothetical protein
VTHLRLCEIMGELRRGGRLNADDWALVCEMNAIFMMGHSAPVDEQAERRRATDRERKRLAAEALRKSAEEGLVKEAPHTPQENNYIYTPAREPKILPAKPLSPDWKPTEEHFAYGERLGLGRIEVDGCAEEMRIWAETANGTHTKKRNWDRAFQGWLRRESKNRKRFDKPAQHTVTRGPWKPFKPEPEIAQPPLDERAAQVDRLLKRSAKGMTQ